MSDCKPITVRETILYMDPDNWYKDERGAVHPIIIHPVAIFFDKPLHYYMLNHVGGNWFEDHMFHQMPDVYIPEDCMDKSCLTCNVYFYYNSLFSFLILLSFLCVRKDTNIFF